MSSIIAIVFVTFVAALAFGAGVFAQRHYQLASIRAAERFARDLTGLDDSVPPAPPWQQWQYPGSDSKGEIQGAKVHVMNELARPAGNYAMFVTKDGFEDVARFYAEKTGFNQPDDVAKSRSAVSSQGSIQGEANYLMDDFVDAADSQKTRPVRAKYLIRRCPSYDLTVLINRANEEDLTHVLVLYDPKTETQRTTR